MCTSRMRVAIILLLSIFANHAFCSKILAIMTVPAHSHHNWNLIYLKALTARGHQVTYLGVDDYPNPAPNITYIQIENAYALYGIMNFTELSDTSVLVALPELLNWNNYEAVHYVKEKGFQTFQNVVKTEKFDLVVFDQGTAPFTLGVVDLLGRPPVIGITPFGAPSWAMDVTGTPYPIQNDPYFLLPMGKEMGFCDRLYNAFVFYYSKYHHSKFLDFQTEVARKAFGPNIRSIHEIQEDMTINMVNMNWATEFPFATSPSFIPVGGLHIKKVQPLPKELKEYLDTAKDGVIYFSLGTNIQSAFLQDREIEILTSAFKKLAPVKILWKWEKDTLPGKPDNVRIEKWLPQNDILPHPNVRLFFTHGGLLSSQETVYHGVPIVGMPIFLDQHVNVRKAAIAGFGEMLTLKHITVEAVVETINKVLQNPGYKENAKKLSKIFKDQANHPLDTAVYWTEYAIRHNGAQHFRPISKNLNWFQNMFYDIALFVLAVSLLTVYTITLVLKGLLRIICGQKQKPKQH